MHLYPKQSRQLMPGSTSTSKPPTAFSQNSVTFAQPPRTLTQEINPSPKPIEEITTYNKAINSDSPTSALFSSTETLPQYPMTFWGKFVVRACRYGFLIMIMHQIIVSGVFLTPNQYKLKLDRSSNVLLDHLSTLYELMRLSELYIY